MISHPVPTPDPAARLIPVVDHTHARGHFPWPARWWKTGEFLIPLEPGMDGPTFGLVMCELLVHLAEDDDFTPEAILKRAVARQPWQLYPGLQVAGGIGAIVTSGCCARLNDWRDWYRVLDGEMVRFGHEPDVTARLEGDIVVVRSHDGPAAASVLLGEPEVVAMTPQRLREALAEVEDSLDGLAARVGEWATALSTPQVGSAVEHAFRSSFAVSYAR